MAASVSSSLKHKNSLFPSLRRFSWPLHELGKPLHALEGPFLRVEKVAAGQGGAGSRVNASDIRQERQAR